MRRAILRLHPARGFRLALAASAQPADARADETPRGVRPFNAPLAHADSGGAKDVGALNEFLATNLRRVAAGMAITRAAAAPADPWTPSQLRDGLTATMGSVGNLERNIPAVKWYYIFGSYWNRAEWLNSVIERVQMRLWTDPSTGATDQHSGTGEVIIRPIAEFQDDAGLPASFMSGSASTWFPRAPKTGSFRAYYQLEILDALTAEPLIIATRYTTATLQDFGHEVPYPVPA